ncbi:MAG: GyrI-like domain-containing protein [Bacillota bacterium]|uniref:GyrI-like domain-containing protein n=1 Tax=Desulforudis sp. DRI-14 TaxID=3459793 RepID=UPI00347307C5
MGFEPVLVKLPAQTVAYRTRSGTFEKIPEVAAEVFLWMKENGHTPGGPPVGVFHSSPFGVPPERQKWELQIPLKNNFPMELPETETTPGVKRLPERKAIVQLHSGIIEDYAAVYQRMFAYVAKGGYRLAGPPEEVYHSPMDAPPEQMKIEIRFPVIKR